ncbi:TetR/AcrR family transcriptional regulator [Alterisphingorhabdus coralli]|uniref:TetR/AcrR family transcriptional regulator n=1 Tax=Alterisphingorhabdus coralli TaxID=3071408 RepID=A0AA97F801_9SPHN|nr:TetR/AcrR family transcriptional regulator [Parasphingorhabdus sp. SCSIO 66989]WOE75616.1 TetR/AcrR family transcriptional regulator [Parasphingorhabdus sp. SCSIO 66989]
MSDNQTTAKPASKAKKPGTKTAGRKANVQGLAAREAILAAAESVLANHGYHQFSTRRVAEACDISVGNLTYHFPGKVKLIEALMQRICTRYATSRRDTEQSPDPTKHRDFEGAVRWIIEDAISSETSRLFVELWVLAKHHDFGAELVDDFYALALIWVGDSLRSHFPEADDSRVEAAAELLLTLSEGSTVLLARGQRPPERLIESAIAAARHIIESETVKPGEAHA